MALAKDRGDIFYVYVLFRLDGAPCYIGKGHCSRWLDHDKRSSNRHLRHIIAQSERPLPRIKLHENLSERQAFDYEVALIAALGREKDGGVLVNVTKGGEGWTGEHSVDSRKLMSDVRKAIFATDPTLCEKISAATKKAMQEPEMKARMAAHRRAWAAENPEHLERLHAARVGQKSSDATRKRQSESSKGVPRPWMSEHTKRIWTGRTHSPESRAKMSKSAKNKPPISAETRLKLSEKAKAQHARAREERQIG